MYVLIPQGLHLQAFLSTHIFLSEFSLFCFFPIPYLNNWKISIWRDSEISPNLIHWIYVNGSLDNNIIFSSPLLASSQYQRESNIPISCTFWPHFPSFYFCMQKDFLVHESPWKSCFSSSALSWESRDICYAVLIHFFATSSFLLFLVQMCLFSAPLV